MARKKKAPAVVVTGISGRLGRLLTKKLHRKFPVIGIDRRPFERAPKDVEMHRFDIRSRRCEEIFRRNEVEAVIHLNIMHNPRRSPRETHEFNIMGTRQMLEYCARYDIPKFILLSTANVYGTGPRNMQYLREDAPLMGAATDSRIRHLIETDMLCTAFFWQHPEVETVVLRPVHICGSVRNAASNYLRLSRIPKLLGFDPVVQVIHEEDVVDAILKTLLPGARGVFNVTGPEPVPLSALLNEVNKPIVEVPHLLFEPVVSRMYKARVWGFPPAELEHLKYGCMVNGSRLREELAYTPQYGLRDIGALFSS